MNLFRALFHILLILTGGFFSILLWAVAIVLFKHGDTHLGLFSMFVFALLVSCLVAYFALQEER